MATQETTSGYPAWWDWEKDGFTVKGRFLRAGRGFTAQGERTFVVLEVDGVERTVWLHHQALASSFAREVHRRPEKRLEIGEWIEIQQLGERTGASGRDYMNYRTEFPDGPVSSHADIFGTPPEPPRAEGATDNGGAGGGTDGDIPFRPE